MRARPFPLRLAIGAVVVLGCSTDDYLVVSVDARPAVRAPAALTIALSNAGSTRTDTFPLSGRAFPVTFSVSAPGRTGELAIAIDASDEGGTVLGRGSATTPIDASGASILLEPTDFVVNTEYADDQFPSSDFEAAGFQLAALPDGTWTAAFRDRCTGGACSIFGRRFDELGNPAETALAAGTNAFTLNTELTTPASTPAIASSQATTLALWDAYSVQGTVNGVACRALDASGQASAAQRAVATDNADVVSLAAMPDGNFVASWNTSLTGTQVVRAVFIRPDCSVLVAAQTISTTPPGGFPHRSAVASSGDRVLFTWLLDGDLHARVALTTGALAGDDTVLLTGTATELITHARVAGLPDGSFALAVRWVPRTAPTSADRIELRRVTSAGTLEGPPALVTDPGASDAGIHESFGLASRTDGTVLVAWHTCTSLGDAPMCDVLGRILRGTGEPVTGVFAIPTTSAGRQVLPSVAGLSDSFVALWSDGSGQPPDIAGTSVRARILYLP